MNGDKKNKRMTDLQLSSKWKKNFLMKRKSNEKEEIKKLHRMKKNESISKNISLFQQSHNELLSSFHIRTLFFELAKPKSKQEMIVANSLSQCLSNMIFLQVRYSKDIESHIEKILSKNSHSIKSKYPILLEIFH